jgi:hypothetical protein
LTLNPARTITGDGVTLVMRTVPETVTGSGWLAFEASAVDVAVMFARPAPTATTVALMPSVDDTVATAELLVVNVTVLGSVPRVSTEAATLNLSPNRMF